MILACRTPSKIHWYAIDIQCALAFPKPTVAPHKWFIFHTRLIDQMLDEMFAHSRAQSDSSSLFLPFLNVILSSLSYFFFATNAHIMRNATAYMLSTCRMSELVLFAHQQIIVRLNMQNDARGLFFALVQLSRLRPQITHTLNYDLFDC